MQAREVTMMQASLTVTMERLHALEEKIDSRLDVSTAVECIPMLSAQKKSSNHIVYSAYSSFKLKIS